MIDFRKISDQTKSFFEETALFLRDIGISTITPEAVAICLWNRDCDRPTHTEALFWSPERQELVMALANIVYQSPSNGNITETDFSQDLLVGFEYILSKNANINLNNLCDWLIRIWLPDKYPQYSQNLSAGATEEDTSKHSYNQIQDSSKTEIFTPVRNPADDDSSTGDTIKEFCDNMLALAINCKLHRAIGREKEMEELLLYLAMNTKNCPALIGKPGTGKTALAEELAYRLVLGETPEPLKRYKLYRLDYSRVCASGEEVPIMTQIINEAASDPDLILFIDEMHLLINNHPQAQNLVAQMLKPPMARGEIKIIGATTYEEYSKNIESDPAFERRFNPIIINEPDPETTKMILRRSEMRFNHGLTLSDKTLEESISLTSKYIRNRYLPAKAIELIDQAAARVVINNSQAQSLTPDDLKFELSQKTGLPLERVSQDEKSFLSKLEENLHHIVVGQNLAVKAVSDAIRLRRSGFGNDERPIGSFLFLGTTGTGKTLLSKAVSKVLFGDKNKMVRLDMSEYREENSTTKLIGPPPGYVGYDNGGSLTNAVIQNPYTVILVDELEKAHPAVHNLFLQVLDEGHLTDNHGRTVDFSNTVVIITSNICQSDILATLPKENVLLEDLENCSAMVMQQLKNYLPLELINRIDKIVMFEPISYDDAVRISELILKQKQEELLQKHNISLRIEQPVIEFVAQKGYDRQYGARNLERAVQELILQPLTEIGLQNNIDLCKPVYSYVKEDQINFKN